MAAEFHSSHSIRIRVRGKSTVFSTCIPGQDITGPHWFWSGHMVCSWAPEGAPLLAHCGPTEQGPSESGHLVFFHCSSLWALEAWWGSIPVPQFLQKQQSVSIYRDMDRPWPFEGLVWPSPGISPHDPRALRTVTDSGFPSFSGDWSSEQVTTFWPMKHKRRSVEPKLV